MIREVLAPENAEVENVKMTAAQTAIGIHSSNNDMRGGWAAIARPLIGPTRGSGLSWNKSNAPL